MTLRHTFAALLAALLVLAPAASAQDLVITGAIDGPLSGGTPKAVELYVLNDIADLSAYGIGSANNGGGTDGEEFTFPADAATAGDFLYIATEDVEFGNWFGFAPDYTSGALAINGDDAVELFFNGAVVDVFGDRDVDGNGEAWEYLDGWAYRTDGTGPDGDTFALANWTFSGPNALDGETDNATAATPFPVGTYETTPSMGAEDFTALLRGENEVPAVETMALGGASATLDGTTLTVTGTFAGLSSDYLFAHLHRGAEGENGPVAYALTLGNPTFGGVTEGSFLAVNNTFTVSPAFADSVRTGLVYVNVHSSANPGGELRGQLGMDTDSLPFSLSGDNEVPPVMTDASGFGTVTLNGTTLSLGGAFSGLGSAYLFSHIHAGAAGENGPVAFALMADVDADMLGGSWDTMANTFELSSTLADSVRAGLAYVNVHSTDNPGGEIRGQIGVAVQMPITLAEARAAGVGASVIVTGTVTRSMGAFTYIQDATGGLTIRQTGGPFRDAVEDGTIAPGVELTIMGTLSEFNSLLQINGGDLAEYEVGETGEVPAAQVVTLSELASNGEAYEAELVTVFNVTLDPDGDAIFDSSTNYAITDASDASNAVAMRVVGSNDTMIDGTAVPTSLLTITGPVGQFSGDDPAAGYQLLPIQRSDVAGTPGEAAFLQVIHNAPDRRVAVVDVFVNGARALNNVAFQTGTAFLSLPSGVALDIAVGPRTAQSADDAFFATSVSLMPGVNYQAVAIGVQDPERFLPNPEGLSTAFTLALNAAAKTEADEFPFNVEVNFMHGSPDAPTVDIRAGGTFDAILFDDIAYGSFSELYQPVAPQMVTLEVTSADGTVSFGEAEVDLSGLGGVAATALATGFADPVGNRNSAPLGVLVVAADGTSFVVPVGTAVAGENDEALELALLAPSPNPATSSTRIGFSLAEAGDATVSVFDALGRRVTVLAEGPMAADRYERTLDTARLAAGVYVVRLQTEGGTMQKTFTVVR